MIINGKGCRTCIHWNNGQCREPSNWREHLCWWEECDRYVDEWNHPYTTNIVEKEKTEMLTTKCENCAHCHVCGIKEERLAMMNMVADNLGPHFDLFCKEYSSKNKSNAVLTTKDEKFTFVIGGGSGYCGCGGNGGI